LPILLAGKRGGRFAAQAQLPPELSASSSDQCILPFACPIDYNRRGWMLFDVMHIRKAWVRQERAAKSMSKAIGICVVGAGVIAERHMQAHERLGGVHPAWVVSRPAEAAADFARRWKFVRCGTELEPALAEPSVQLVLISSPSPLHSEQAIAALRAGKDVIVEIPVALSWPHAQGLAQVAAQLGRRVWVCHTLRSTAALRLVRERVRGGQLHLTHISGFFGIPRRRNQGMGGVGTRTWIDNLLWHHGCHQVDASLWVLEMPAVRRVQALWGQAHPALGMALDAGVQIVTAGGELITQSLSYNVERGLWQLQFIGHEDVLTFEDGRLTSETGERLVPETSLADLIVQNRELLHAFRSGEKCEYDLASVLPTMEVLGRAQACADPTHSMVPN
jgi:2-hydroxy-4-carboxymuconate semialdehyde hemiacetal dehydrogenase